jgi:hypothetical protein
LENRIVAKKKTGGSGNMSQAIREVLTKNPEMEAKEVISTLAAQGIKVKSGLVYFIKGNIKGKSGRLRKVQQAAAAVAAPSGNGDALSTIVKVKKLADDVGGLKKLRALVEALSE